MLSDARHSSLFLNIVYRAPGLLFSWTRSQLDLNLKRIVIDQFDVALVGLSKVKPYFMGCSALRSLTHRLSIMGH